MHEWHRHASAARQREKKKRTNQNKHSQRHPPERVDGEQDRTRVGVNNVLDIPLMERVQDGRLVQMRQHDEVIHLGALLDARLLSPPPRPPPGVPQEKKKKSTFPRHQPPQCPPNKERRSRRRARSGGQKKDKNGYKIRSVLSFLFAESPKQCRTATTTTVSATLVFDLHHTPRLIGVFDWTAWPAASTGLGSYLCIYNKPRTRPEREYKAPPPCPPFFRILAKTLKGRGAGCLLTGQPIGAVNADPWQRNDRTNCCSPIGRIIVPLTFACT